MGFTEFFGKKKKRAGEALSSLGATARSYASGAVKKTNDYFAPAPTVRTRDFVREAGGTVGDMFSGTKNVATKAPKIFGEGLAYATSKNVRDQYKAGNTNILPTISSTTPRRMLADTAKAALEIAPVGKIKTTAKLLMAPSLVKRVAGGSGLGYAYDVADKMSKDDRIGKETFTPGMGTVAGGVMSGVLKPTAQLAKQGIDDVVRGAKKTKEIIELVPEATRNSIANRRGPARTDVIPKRKVYTDVTPVSLKPATTVLKPTELPGQTIDRYRTPTLSDLGRQVRNALPTPGMSIKNVSRKKSDAIIAAKNEKARQIVRNQVNLQRSGAQVAEPGFVQPSSVKAPQNAKTESAQARFARELDEIPTPWAKNAPDSTFSPKDWQELNALAARQSRSAADTARYTDLERRFESLTTDDQMKLLGMEKDVMVNFADDVLGGGSGGELGSQYDRFVGLFKNPKLRNPAVKDAIMDGDLGTLKRELSKRGVMSPSDVDGMFYDDTRSGDEILELFKNNLRKENPKLMMGRRTANNLIPSKETPVVDGNFKREADRLAKEQPSVPSDPMPNNIRAIKENVDNGVLVGPKSYAKLRQWEEAQARKAAETTKEVSEQFGVQTGPFNKYQEAAYQAKQERVQSIREVSDVPGTLRAMGFTKKEAGKLGVEESKIIAELGKLGYPKDDPLLRDVRSETVKRILENKVQHLTLKEYYKKKHELDTHIMDGIDPKALRDISPLQAGTRDVYRNFEDVFGGGKYDNPTFQKVKKDLLDPFDASKGEFIAEQKMQLGALEEHIVNGLGIEKGSKLSAAVQMFGEGKLTLEQVKEKFPKDWQKIVKANDWFRNMYDNMLDETNRVREYFFPTHPLYPESSKVIPKRQNYYRHFQEMADGFKGLMNIFDTPANIDPSLAVSSQYTKPGSKWLSFAQQRNGEQTEFDAVGGFLDYIKANAYAKHIDPHIQRFRGVDAEVKSKLPFPDTRIGLAEELSKKMDPFERMAEMTSTAKLKDLLIEKGLTDRDALKMGKDIAKIKDAAGVKDYLEKNLTPEGMAEFKARALAEESGNKLNNFLKFLDNFASDLAGKTNPLDRPIQDNFLGRQTFRAINWMNSRVKANVILGNIGSAVAQFFGIPNGIANAGARNSTKAVGSSLLGILKDDVPSAKSAFLNERYFNGYDKFDPGVVANGKRLAVWLTSIGDKIGTTFTWNAQYEKALAEGVADPIKYADDWTRRMVAGRGVGEVPIMQKSKLIQIFAPFQLEVANQWRVFGDWARNDPSKLAVAKKLMEYSVAVWVMNQVAKELRGSDVAFDPINAMTDAYESFQDADGAGEGVALAGGRIAGEVLSNLPGGSTAAAFYPEFGKKDVLGTGVDIPTREKFFGDKDPTRFGNGIMAGRAFLEPQYMVLPPYGGRQIKNTIEGAGTLLQGYAETAAGKVMTPVDSTIPNVMKGVLFGKNSLDEVQDYREADSNPLGEKQDEIFRVLPNGERESYYGSLMNTRAANKEKQALKDGVLSGKVQGEAGAVGEGMYQLKDGNFFVPNLRADTKTFKTQELAQVAIEKEDFETSGENFRDLGEYVLRKREDGTVYPQRKDIFTTQLLSARMTGAKKSNNFDEWMKHAEQKYELLGRLVADPTVDELDRAEFQNQMMTLEDDIEKYSEYGGAFKKGRKLEEKYRYPLVDKDMLAVERMIKYGPVPTGFTRTRRPLALAPFRARKVKRYKKRR